MYVLDYKRRFHDFSIFTSHYVSGEQHGVESCEVHLLKTLRGLFCNVKVVLYPLKRAQVVGLVLVGLK